MKDVDVWGSHPKVKWEHGSDEQMKPMKRTGECICSAVQYVLSNIIVLVLPPAVWILSIFRINQSLDKIKKQFSICHSSEYYKATVLLDFLHSQHACIPLFLCLHSVPDSTGWMGRALSPPLPAGKCLWYDPVKTTKVSTPSDWGLLRNQMFNVQFNFKVPDIFFNIGMELLKSFSLKCNMDFEMYYTTCDKRKKKGKKKED